MRKTSNYGVLAVIVCALAVLWVAPAAQACCTPCDPWCKVFLDPDDYCCTGIPEPGNACGLTICAKWKEMQGYDLTGLTALFQAPAVSSAAADSCQGEAPAFLARTEEADPAVEAQETGEADS